MKSEERHQLLTNDLGVVTKSTLGFFEQHLESVLAVVCALFVIIAGIFWWTQSGVADNSDGWTMLDTAKNLQEFGFVADKFKGKAPGQWAQLKIAEKTAQNAMPLMFSNRDLAKADLKAAVSGFETLIQDRTVPPTIRERALWGLALCLETTSDGDTSKAIQAFERLITEYPATIFKTVADERIAALKKPDATEFYGWFSTENPKPKEASPEDFKDGIHLPAPKTEEDDDIEDVEPSGSVRRKAPATEKSDTTVLPADQSNNATKTQDAPPGDKGAEQAKPVEGEKPAAAGEPKDGDQPVEKK